MTGTIDFSEYEEFSKKPFGTNVSKNVNVSAGAVINKPAHANDADAAKWTGGPGVKQYAKKNKPFTVAKAVKGALGTAAFGALATDSILNKRALNSMMNIDLGKGLSRLGGALKGKPLVTAREQRLVKVADEVGGTAPISAATTIGAAVGIAGGALTAASTIDKAIRAHKAKKIAQKLR